MSKMYLDQLNLDFKIPANLGRESDLYLPSNIARTLCDELDRVGMEYRIEDMSRDIIHKHIPVPAALLQWKQRFEADGGKSYIAFLDKKHLPFTLHAGDGKPATEYFGMSTPDLAKQFFKEIEEEALTPERVLDPAKSLAETVTVHIKQPTPPIKVR